ncbi:MAG: hypothetical protein E7586_03545 [Ruminococcaceae bacterium]|nr:hypothetical protein [Oscillospiraceae bacterium]
MKKYKDLKIDKKYKILLSMVLFYVVFILWIAVDDLGPYALITLSDLSFFFVQPVFSAIYGCLSYISFRNVILPNLAFAIITLAFCFVAELCGAYLYVISYWGIAVSLVVSLLTKLIVYIKNKLNHRNSR